MMTNMSQRGNAKLFSLPQKHRLLACRWWTEIDSLGLRHGWKLICRCSWGYSQDAVKLPSVTQGDPARPGPEDGERHETRGDGGALGTPKGGRAELEGRSPGLGVLQRGTPARARAGGARLPGGPRHPAASSASRPARRAAAPRPAAFLSLFG